MSPRAAAKARNWTIGMVFVSILILIAAWFLVASPLWDAASEANVAADDQEAKNDNEQIQVTRLKAQFAKMDQYEALLEDLRVQVPTTLEHAEFQRQFAEIADDHDVTVVNISYGTSTKVSLTLDEAAQIATPLASAALPTTTDDAAATDDTATTDDDSTATAAADEGSRQAFTNFYLVPVTIEVRGGYDDVLAAVKALQNSDQRIMLVTSLDGSGMTAAEATGGEAAVKDGDLSLTIDGTLSVLLDPESKTSVPDDETVESPDLPTPKAGENPLTTGN